MLTILTAIVMIALMMSIWIGVDQMSKKRFGERQLGCRRGQPGEAYPGEAEQHDCCACAAAQTCPGQKACPSQQKPPQDEEDD